MDGKAREEATTKLLQEGNVQVCLSARKMGTCLLIDGAASGVTKRRHDVTFPLLTQHRRKAGAGFILKKTMGDFKVGVSICVYCTKCTLNTGVNTNFGITHCVYRVVLDA
jgi:hypothetical protein